MSCDTRVPLPCLDSAGEAYEKLRSQDAATVPDRVVTGDRPGGCRHIVQATRGGFRACPFQTTDVAALRDHNTDAYSPPVRARREDRFPFAAIALVVALGSPGAVVTTTTRGPQTDEVKS